MTDDEAIYWIPAGPYRVDGSELRWRGDERVPVTKVEKVLDELVSLTRPPHSPHTTESVVVEFACKYGPWSWCGPHHWHEGFRKATPWKVQEKSQRPQDDEAAAAVYREKLRLRHSEPVTSVLSAAHRVNSARSLMIDLKAGAEPRDEDWDRVFEPTFRWDEPRHSDRPKRVVRRHPIPDGPLARLAEVGDQISLWMANFHATLQLRPYHRSEYDDLGMQRLVPIAGVGGAVAHALFLEASQDRSIGRCSTCGVTWKVRRRPVPQRCGQCGAAVRQRKHRGGK